MGVIDVNLVTWPNHPKRIQYLRQTVESLRTFLTASKHELRYHCSSESERDPKYSWHGDELEAICKEHGIELSWRKRPAALGANMNVALRMGRSDLILLVQDDYPLAMPLDLSIGATFMEETPSVDILRYRWPETPKRVALLDHPDGWRRFDPKSYWIYGDDPHLRRREFAKRFGWYRENCHHGISENLMLEVLRRRGAEIAASDREYFASCGWCPATTRPKCTRREIANV
ncbi:MAG TPA: hypothetical protein VM118_09890 [Acidobacteriota bacterium]|nr:hypothetical protein [Acidobacteriota bacterium]